MWDLNGITSIFELGKRSNSYAWPPEAVIGLEKVTFVTSYFLTIVVPSRINL
jgi:hypothetical protein